VKVGVVKDISMDEPRRRMGNYPDKLAKHIHAALPEFRYEAGYTFSASDLGKLGVKIELNKQYDTGVAIILPPGKVGECGIWLLETLEQEDKGLLTELLDILERLSKQKGGKVTLQRGDKKTIKDAIKVLKKQSSKMWSERSALRALSKKAI
jgi:hypothetical protein